MNTKGMLFVWLCISVLLAFADAIVCPGGTHQCPDYATCCQLVDKSYGCCPLQDAVCCEDHIHCCPMNSQCVGGMCIRNSTGFTRMKAPNVICPGGQFQCPDGSTCCKLPTGQWGCCPFERATCCNDHLHCCPEHMKCDTTYKSCQQGLTNITWAENRRAAQRIPFSEVICPDKKKHCPDNTTCCPLEGGDYGCCPYDDAVCCSDFQHCCPKGFECDVAIQRCVHRQKSPFTHIWN